MGERIDNLVYAPAEHPSTVEGTETSLYLTGPAEFLCKEICAQLVAIDVWSKLFGEYIDPYKRMDYPIRGTPALRVYNNTFVKEYESWFIEGDVTADLIFPASLRRKELQQIPDSISAALLQQFRRTGFFTSICAKVPGLNELGKRFDVDKSLAFEWGEELLPLTQVTLNFKIDLRQWDLYLETDNRTKDDPFCRTLGDLNRIITTIQALRDDDSVELEITSDQRTT